MSHKAFCIVVFALFLAVCSGNPTQPSSAAAEGKQPAAKPGTAAADYVGQWTCPGRGVMTLVVKDGMVVGTAAGSNDEDWGGGPNGGRGVRITEGTVKDGVLHMRSEDGLGHKGTQTMRLSADGKGFEGEWEFEDGGQTIKGTWKGSR
jgi:hypothetical protein